METRDISFTTRELEQLRAMCVFSEAAGLDWVRAVSIFPAETEEEKNWKSRMLAGLSLIRSGVYSCEV